MSTQSHYSMEAKKDDQDHLKIISPSASRNTEPIVEQLSRYFDDGFQGKALSVAEGSGQHVAAFAKKWKGITFQPTDLMPDAVLSINAYTKDLENVLPAAAVDITEDALSWDIETLSEGSLDLVFNANMIHISPYATAEGIMRNSAYLLREGGHLIMYGPYNVDGKFTHPNNEKFDTSLRSRDPSWGIRDVGQVSKTAEENGLSFVEKVDMPANNFIVVFSKKTSS